MAKNYTMAEAVEIIAKGEDVEAIQDLGKRYPLLLSKVTKVAAKAGEDFVELMGYMPEHLTANKVNKAIKEALVGGEDDSEEVTEEVKPAKKTKKTRKPAKIEEPEEDDVEEDVEEEGDNPYEGKTAVELFQECKDRGIKVKPKRTAKFYMNLLIQDDESKAENAEEDVEDDWEDEEEEAPAPKKSAKKVAAKKSTKKPAAKKAAKKAEPVEEEDDDDDWDI